MSKETEDKIRILHGDTAGVCYNCLNGFHDGCDSFSCSCRIKEHKAWWWKTQEEIDEEEKEIFLKHVYWTKEEVECYNAAIDKAIEVVKECQVMSASENSYSEYDEIISKLNQLKR